MPSAHHYSNHPPRAYIAFTDPSGTSTHELISKSKGRGHDALRRAPTLLNMLYPVSHSQSLPKSDAVLVIHGASAQDRKDRVRDVTQGIEFYLGTAIDAQPGEGTIEVTVIPILAPYTSRVIARIAECQAKYG